MSDFHTFTKIKRGRKAHQCDYCGCVIEIGEPSLLRVGSYGGDFFSARGHEDCEAMWAAIYALHNMWGESMAFSLFEALSDDLHLLPEWQAEFPHVVARLWSRMDPEDDRLPERMRAEPVSP
jgi:hypothetical protein